MSPSSLHAELLPAGGRQSVDAGSDPAAFPHQKLAGAPGTCGQRREAGGKPWVGRSHQPRAGSDPASWRAGCRGHLASDTEPAPEWTTCWV